IEVFGHPAHAPRTERHHEHRPGAVPDAAGALDHFETRPRRREPLQRSWTGVPAEGLFCRRINAATPDELFHLHFRRECSTRISEAWTMCLPAEIRARPEESTCARWWQRSGVSPRTCS